MATFLIAARRPLLAAAALLALSTPTGMHIFTAGCDMVAQLLVAHLVPAVEGAAQS